MVIFLLSTMCVCPELFSCIIGLDVLDKIIVSDGTYGLSGVQEDLVWFNNISCWCLLYFLVMERPTCSDCVPVRVLAFDDGKFTA